MRQEITWSNFGLEINHTELCNFCMKDCTEKLIRPLHKDSVFIIKCSLFKCKPEYEATIRYIKEKRIRWT